jgi:U1 small nuclear ribonucleoprotein C
MPKFYCDYCDIYLTHDSLRVRRDHGAGWKHKMQIQNYYANIPAYKVQQVINQITKAYVYAGLGGFPGMLI